MSFPILNFPLVPRHKQKSIPCQGPACKDVWGFRKEYTMLVSCGEENCKCPDTICWDCSDDWHSVKHPEQKDHRRLFSVPMSNLDMDAWNQRNKLEEKLRKELKRLEEKRKKKEEELMEVLS